MQSDKQETEIRAHLAIQSKTGVTLLAFPDMPEVNKQLRGRYYIYDSVEDLAPIVRERYDVLRILQLSDEGRTPSHVDGFGTKFGDTMFDIVLAKSELQVAVE